MIPCVDDEIPRVRNVPPRITRGVVILWTVALLLAAVGPAKGHAILVESIPAHGAALEEAPQVIILRFNARLEPSMVRMNLVDINRAQTPLDTTQDSTVDRIVVKVPSLSPGVYTLVYKVLARDGHVTEGFVRFTVLGH